MASMPRNTRRRIADTTKEPTMVKEAPPPQATNNEQVIDAVKQGQETITTEFRSELGAVKTMIEEALSKAANPNPRNKKRPASVQSPIEVNEDDLDTTTTREEDEKVDPLTPDEAGALKQVNHKQLEAYHKANEAEVKAPPVYVHETELFKFFTENEDEELDELDEEEVKRLFRLFMTTISKTSDERQADAMRAWKNNVAKVTKKSRRILTTALETKRRRKAKKDAEEADKAERVAMAKEVEEACEQLKRLNNIITGTATSPDPEDTCKYLLSTAFTSLQKAHVFFSDPRNNPKGARWHQSAGEIRRPLCVPTNILAMAIEQVILDTYLNMQGHLDAYDAAMMRDAQGKVKTYTIQSDLFGKVIEGDPMVLIGEWARNWAHPNAASRAAAKAAAKAAAAEKRRLKAEAKAKAEALKKPESLDPATEQVSERPNKRSADEAGPPSKQPATEPAEPDEQVSQRPNKRSADEAAIFLKAAIPEHPEGPPPKRPATEQPIMLKIKTAKLSSRSPSPMQQ